MFMKQITDEDNFKTFSIYSSFCGYTLRYQSYKSQNPSQLKNTVDISIFDSCFLFVRNCLSRLSKFNIFSITWNFWYLFTDQTMHQGQCSVSTNTQQFQLCQVQEILKNNLGNDSQSSEDFVDVQNNKPKKSIFATFIRKREAHPKMKITKKIETFSTINFGTESLSSDEEIANYNYSDMMTTLQNVAGPSKQNNFFKKIMKRPTKKPYKKIQRCYNPTKCDKNNVKGLTVKELMPTTYMPKQNIKIITGINELQDILHNLHHSEQHMIYLLKKYVKDKRVQKQLFEASFEYFALQYDAKTQVNVLGNKMWFQQIQVAKMEDYNLQKRLNSLVKANRSLEEQVETLHRQCEKLASKTNVYPKRFLHMRSFGKLYARQLIDNNRKLQKRVNVLTIVISDFEEEIEKLQHQKAALEEERRSSKSQIYTLEGLLNEKKHDYELEKSSISVQLNQQQETIKEVASATQVIFHDLEDFECQLQEFSIKVTWPTLEFSNLGLPEILHQLRASIGKMFVAMFNAYKNVSASVQDISRLRNTNARLQENLQKSTTELDNLSKKLEQSSETEIKPLESKCRQLERKNSELRAKLSSISDENNALRDEIQRKKSPYEVTESQSLNNQLEELVLTASTTDGADILREFTSSRDKFEYLKVRYVQIMADQKQLVERCNSLEDANQSLLQAQQLSEQDLATLQDGITMVSAENDTIRKQLATEHQTVLTLQNERLKYLEEKNILKTIFQHLKSEVSRIQQLEGAVADMSKETSRLTLLAEFNNQLGEHLKQEVETKESTITELRQSLEKLSHIQLESDKEKFTLSTQLSEVVTLKEKLSDCLELELKKNMRLDESRKKLECSTKSQIKIYEEMQKNERAALRELLRDFKNLIKQRDCLILIQDENKKKYKDLDKRYTELKKQHEDAVTQVNQKEDEIKTIVEKLQTLEEEFHKQEESRSSGLVKYEKTIRKMEKLLGQFRTEKGDLETNNNLLKNNLQKLQNELNTVRQQASNDTKNLAAKIAECATIESELITYKNDLQTLQQEHGKALMEMEYLKKMHEQQTTDLRGTISNYSNKETTFAELQNTIFSRDQQINELNKIVVAKEEEIKRLEQECKFLNKQTEDQNKIMIGYENHFASMQAVENAKLNLENELAKAELEHKTCLNELEKVKLENDGLKDEMKGLIAKIEKERSFYKKQSKEIISECSEQKTKIEGEIDSISTQLRIVTNNLQSEKRRFEELVKAHEDLKANYTDLKRNLSSEVTANKESHQKIEDMTGYIQSIINERDHFQQQMQLLYMGINEEKDANLRLIAENKKLELILQQGKEHYLSVENKCGALDKELNQVKLELMSTLNKHNSSQEQIDKITAKLAEKENELATAKEAIECLRKELSESQTTLFGFKEEFFKMQQHMTGLEFKNCELTLQLHETQGKLETEKHLYKELQMKLQKNPERTHSPSPSEGGELFY